MSLLDRITKNRTVKHGDHPRQSVDVALAGKPLIVSKRSRPLQKVGDVELQCPYCGYTLEREPVRKRRCVTCGNYIYVRTTPIDGARVIVTEEEAVQIEKQWQHYNQEKEREELESDPEYGQMKAELAAERGAEPSVEDIRWALANRRLLQHARNGSWGLYRNAKLEIARILRKEERLRDALETYLEVCYLDVNGFSNTGGPNGPLLEKSPPSDLTRGLIAPGVISQAQELSSRLDLETDNVKSLFFKTAEIMHDSLRLPITPAEAWEQIRFQLKVARGDHNIPL